MKPKCFLFLVLLGFGRLGLTVSSFDESNVKSYHVERRPDSNPDLFVVELKSGSQCDICTSLKAHFHRDIPCTCTCPSDNSTFLPSLRNCISQSHLPANFTDCPNQKYEKIDGKDLFKFPVNLQINKKEKTSVSSVHYNCSLYGYYLDYSGFKVRWKNITDGVFNLTKENNPNKKFSIQWEDKDGKLSGMIIYLKLTCVGQNKSKEKCYLLKALGNVTYYAPSTSSSGSFITVPTAVSSPNPSSMFAFSPSPQLSQSMQTFSQSLSPQPTTSPSPSPSLDATTGSPTKHTDKFSTFVSKHVETSSLQTRPVLHSAGPILPSTSTAELESFLPVSSEEISNHVINTGIPKSSASTEEPNYSEPSELPTTESSLPTRDGPGDKEARKGGKDKGVAIGAGVGGAVVFGIIVIGLIIVFCKRRRLGESTEKKAKLHVGVKNPVYEKPQDDIKMERPREKATTFSKQDSQPTYLELVDNKVGHENYGAVYSTADENYDNSSVYQSLDNNTPAAPSVYQSLQNNQPSTKKPIPKQKQSNAKNPGKPSVPPDPVYSVLEESHIKQGNTSEAIYNVLEGPDPGQDTPGNIQDPVYNVLDGAGAGQTDEAPDVGVQQDPLYNVLEVPESKQEHQEPLYNVLENADTENAPSRQHGSSDGATSEPLYNVLDGADSSGAEYAAPNRPLSADSHDNPAYEQTLEFGAPHALVDSPGSQRESLYEPLKGSDRQDVYEPLHKKGK
ncbi:uncharacterized protein LOC113672512 [Pocillopora damicornis]|uniref:uncharacterized protein LOC113672512 n=1 Tax=Pocillopora damicornis TaxID=46731 RepID=UPI000F54FBB8|nr:uncharacterized protein LOC113672512 [Pocillopora damicornis]